jgi:imidazolonepropionase-like amidohydrolase
MPPSSRALLLAALCLLLSSLPIAHAQAPATNAVLFEGARVIPGDGTRPIENAAFIVENGRFTRIGRRGDVKAPEGAARVDLTGKTVMPALVDTHNHLGTTRSAYVQQLKLLAFVGIAAATSMGRDSDVVFEVRAEQPPDGAQILTSGRGLVGALGLKPETIAAGVNGRLPEDLREIALQVRNEEQAREHVRHLASQRVDFIKIWVDDRLGTEVPMSPTLYRAIFDEAHKHSLRVFVHSWYLQDAKDLLRAGVDAFAHPIRDKDVDDELIGMLKDRPNVHMQTNLHSTYFYTLSGEQPWLKDPLFLDITSPAEVQRIVEQLHDNSPRIHEGWTGDKLSFARPLYARMVRNTKRLYDAGVHYALGTDGGAIPQGFDAHVELELLVRDVGLTPSQAITVATKNAAEALHLADLGGVISGKVASFIVLDANPLDDITNTRRISKVYMRGHEIDRAAFKEAWANRRGRRTVD